MNNKFVIALGLIVLASLASVPVGAAGLGQLFDGKSPTQPAGNQSKATTNPPSIAPAKPTPTVSPSVSPKPTVKPKTEDQIQKK
jgi:hypothetical protein